MINLYSDTQTLPTEEMLQAITKAELGDDVLREDPTVRRLEEKAAELLGKEAALLVTSGTQGNTVALMTHGGPGDEVYVDPDAHVYYYECGSLCSLAGYTPRLVPAERGVMDPAALKEMISPPDDHFPRPKLLWIENTHNRGGGKIIPPQRQSQLIEIARQHNMKVHIDGARIFNAAVALGVPASELCREADSVQFCLSKGLSCPVGSLVLGPRDFIDEARRVRKRLGGGMRQAGIIAACGLVALRQSWIERLAEDHHRAKKLAQLLLEAPGVSVDPEAVETNMVYLDISGWGVCSKEAQRILLSRGLKVSARPPRGLRLVTHRHITDQDIEKAVQIMREVGRELSTRAAVSRSGPSSA